MKNFTLYDLRHGNYSLARTYWLYGVTVGIGFSIMFSFWNNPLIIRNFNKNTIFLHVITTIFLNLIHLIYYYNFYAGLTNCIIKYKGFFLWKILASITLIIGGIFYVVNCIYLLSNITTLFNTI